MDIRKRSNLWWAVIGCVSLMLFQLNIPFAYADGSETLGPPSISIGSGTGIAAAGVGLSGTQTGMINIDVPDGATVNQVLLYWEGRHDFSPGEGDDTITVNGTSVTGVLIGGMNLGTAASSAYRADITGLGAVSAGTNNLSIGGMNFDDVNNGAGALVIFDAGVTGPAAIDLRDGNDFAFEPYVPPQDTTVPQTFFFAASTVERTATLKMFFSSVSGTASSGAAGLFRPTAIEVTLGDGTKTTFNNELDSMDGEEWDTISLDIVIPAGETSVTVQALSVDNNAAIPSGTTRDIVASFHWIAAGLSITPPAGGEGCTPGFWKNHVAAWASPYDPDDDFADFFEDAFPGKTLHQVLELGGGGLNALGRHTVAALLNAAHIDINYGIATPTGVINAFDAVYEGGKAEYENQKDIFEDFNENGCPINGKSRPVEEENGRKDQDRLHKAGGTIKTMGGSDICAMVLASGRFMFSCNPNGVYSLSGLPGEGDGTVKRQIYADGFFPKVNSLSGSTNESVVMMRSGTCPKYNSPHDPAFVPNSAGKRIKIAGKVLLQNSQAPICAMVLANGKHMFSCDGSGSYALNIPLDNNGQFKLQVYADGFAPTIKSFDEFNPVNDIRMARAAECQ
jgi:hypothetical protein